MMTKNTRPSPRYLGEGLKQGNRLTTPPLLHPLPAPCYPSSRVMYDPQEARAASPWSVFNIPVGAYGNLEVYFRHSRHNYNCGLGKQQHQKL